MADLIIEKLPHYQWENPQYKTEGAGCFDLRACLEDGTEVLTLWPGTREKIRIGLKFQFSDLYTMIIAVRSSIGHKGLILSNGIAIIDSDFRGETVLSVKNIGEEPVKIENGERFAQAMLIPRIRANINFGQVNETTRGEGMLGSTGKD